MLDFERFSFVRRNIDFDTYDFNRQLNLCQSILRGCLPTVGRNFIPLPFGFFWYRLAGPCIFFSARGLIGAVSIFLS